MDFPNSERVVFILKVLRKILYVTNRYSVGRGREGEGEGDDCFADILFVTYSK